MRGAFKTPTLRDITLTAPYFHDGSARTLRLDLSTGEKEDLVAFMQALTTPRPVYVYPVLPKN